MLKLIKKIKIKINYYNMDNNSGNNLSNSSNIGIGNNKNSNPLAYLLKNIILHSAIIIPVFVFILGFVFQNYKGLLYLLFLIVCCGFREFSLKYIPRKDGIIWKPVNDQDAEDCAEVQISKYGIPGFSVFVLAFTFVYLMFPMFYNNEYNWWLFSFLIIDLMAVIVLRNQMKCIHNFKDIFVNIGIGGLLSASLCAIFYATGNSKYLFFNELSNKEVCNLPTKQKFKCTISKNGTVIGTINK